MIFGYIIVLLWLIVLCWNNIEVTGTAVACSGTATCMDGASLVIQSLFRAAANDPTVCSMFLWNPFSFAKYKLCNRLLRGKIVEGRHGRKYVRIRPGSILDMLYPCSQWAPDTCARCGGSFDQHLVKSWKKKWNTPFDRKLDEILLSAIVSGKSEFQHEADCIYFKKGEFELDTAKSPPKMSHLNKKRQNIYDNGLSLEKGRPLNFHLIYFSRSDPAPPGRLQRRRFFMSQAFYKTPSISGKDGPFLAYYIRSKALKQMDKLLKLQTIENYKRWEAR